MIKVKKATVRPYKRIVFGGEPSIGKSTAATNWSTKGLWIDLDNRIPPECVEKCTVLDGITDYKTLKMALISIVKEDKIPYDAIILDTVTLAEAMTRTYSIEVDYKGSATNYADYSKGDKTSLPIHIGILLGLLDQIAEKHKCDIILICHSEIKPVKNPNGENYDKACLNLVGSIRNKVLQWADLVAFAWVNVDVEKVGMTNKAKGTGTRVISFANNPRFDAKGPAYLDGDLEFDIAGKWIDKVKQKPTTNKGVQ